MNLQKTQVARPEMRPIEVGELPFRIEPGRIAFDIDGVVADTMATFLRLARIRFGFTWLRKEDLWTYDLQACLDIEKSILDELICLTLDDENTLETPPMEGAVDVLTELARFGTLKFVTARIWPQSIEKWLHQTLRDVPTDSIKVFATGDPEAKGRVLQDLEVEYFVEDRFETCHVLAKHGIQPLLFDQPWNRGPGCDGFPRIENWAQLSQLIFLKP